MLLENMKMALSSLRANKLRSILTMLGIIIGIGSVISIVSIGDTMRKMFSDLYKNAGVTQAAIMINPYMDQEEIRDSDFFTMDDLEKVKEVFGDRLDYIDNMSSGSLDIKNGLNRLKTNVEGVDTAYQKLQPVQILNGRYISKSDVAERRAVIMISESTAMKLYGTVNVTGKSFRSDLLGENREFSIIGVYRKDISPIQKLLMGSDDKNGEGIVPWTLLSPQSSTFSVIRYYGKTGMSDLEMKQLNTELKAYFSKAKNRQPSDWYISSIQDEMKQVDGVMGGISAAVGGIAAISLLVGGIGIMNIMLVSVTERTREIGIRKALGASTGDILVQFLTESALLSALGGLIGVLLAMGLVSLGATAFGLSVVIRPGIILIAVVFSAIVGIFFGIYPANKAAKEDPIVALRYE
ncbi:ABC transporter permease [Oribacterium sinus]|jgi:ABC superfamily ATP binding cassette transporter, membrane protein|uniref:ABC transporter permease n=1 Tax=Oribacterium sinus TaxID=237576 RepID=UPI0028DB1B1E|nr:ABC transporter permease [Oribacterium sinus]